MSSTSIPTTLIVEEGLVVKSLKNIHETIDPRISLEDRPHPVQLDESLARQLSHLVRQPFHGNVLSETHASVLSDKNIVSEESEPIYVSFWSLSTNVLLTCGVD